MTDSRKHTELDLQTVRRIWSMLPVAFKGRAIRLWLLMVLGALLEMLGVGLVVPVITMLTQPELLSRQPFFKDFYVQVGEPSQQTLVIATMLFLLSVYLCKNLYLGFLAWKQSKFIYGLQHALSTRLFAVYMRQPYSFHLQRNSAHLVRNLQGEMSMFINAAVTPSIFILAELLVVFGLFVMLLLIEPMGSMAVFGILLIAGFSFQKMTKKRVAYWGKQRLVHEGIRIKQLHHGLGGVKDAKLLGREVDFLQQYDLHTRQSMRMNQRQSVMQQLPRLWLELLAISALAVLLVSMTMQGKSMLAILPTLALFAAVSFRLMPSANRIISSIQQLRFGLPVVQMLHDELNLPSEDQGSDGKAVALRDSLLLEHASYAYPAAKKPAVQDICLTIAKGEMVGFVGESGSGKSTLIDIVLGLLKPESGKVLVDGADIQQNLRAWQNQIGYVPQSIYLTDDTLRRNVAFGLAEEDIDDDAVRRALKAAQLQSFVDALPEGMHTIVGERGVRLSGGQRQRIGIARALYHDPAVLVLDEATSALDNETEAEVMNAVLALQRQKTILIVAHRLSTVARCDHIVQLNEGRIEQQGTPSNIIRAVM
jgi:ABC-type multidrug transport system fused ATPase/permease subunit